VATNRDLLREAIRLSRTQRELIHR
jgi:hypothetical protein